MLLALLERDLAGLQRRDFGHLTSATEGLQMPASTSETSGTPERTVNCPPTLDPPLKSTAIDTPRIVATCC